MAHSFPFGPPHGRNKTTRDLLTYVSSDIQLFPSRADKPLVWMAGKIKTPPFSPAARIETGMLLRLLQQGESLGLPHSRPMPNIGPRCHELRVRDETHHWRIFYHLDPKEVVVLAIHDKTTPKTPTRVIEICQRRTKLYQLLP